MFINYAHRGASGYAPENTISAFKLGIKQGANGLETDVRYTKDKKLVLFHDESLERATGQKGKISDYTYDETRKFYVCFSENSDIVDKIPLLEDLLLLVSGKSTVLALEIKQIDIEKDLALMISKFGVISRTTVTSFDIRPLFNIKKINPDIRIGYLVSEISNNIVSALKSVKAEEVCPCPDAISQENVDYLHSIGFKVRAWGVKDVMQMEYVYRCGVDGMTFNYPNILSNFIKKHGRDRNHAK